jgi:hypothetical protein
MSVHEMRNTIDELEARLEEKEKENIHLVSQVQ